MRKKAKSEVVELKTPLAENGKPKSKFKIIKRILYVFMLIIMFSVGLGLMFHQSIGNKIVEGYSETYVRETTPEKMVENENADVSFDPGNVGTLMSTDVLAEVASGVVNGDAESTSSESSGNHYTNLPVVGAMAIPQLDMNLPVVKGLDNASLAIGAGTMKDGQKMGVGNYAVASHSLFYGWRYEELLFSPLRRAEKGMKIYTRDSEKIYTYVIDDIFVVNPDAGYVASDTEGDGLITMITCTDRYATQRLIVRGKIEKSEPIKDAPSEVKDYFGTDWTRWW